MAEYRIDELAREAATTVRNVRSYQDRGLLPPPRREGRVGIYTDSHLARLRLIGQLLERGYSLANIAELQGAWERGHDLGAVLGLEHVVTSPWTDEVPTYITLEELVELFPGAEARFAQEAAALGLLEAEGPRLRVPSPRLLHAGAELYAAGVPLDAVLEHARALRGDIESIAARFLQLFSDHVLRRYLEREGGAELSGAELASLVDLIGRLRPLAQMAVDAELARAMERHTLDLVRDQMAHLADLFGGAPHRQASAS
ncbi:MAG: MerR family transcriptional regulator [Acidimicrobiales bacterium]